MPEEYEAHDNLQDSFEEYWQPEDACHKVYWSYGSNSNPDNALDSLFMGNDLCSKDNTSGEYYTYNTDLTDCFSHSLDYIYNYDS